MLSTSHAQHLALCLCGALSLCGSATTRASSCTPLQDLHLLDCQSTESCRVVETWQEQRAVGLLLPVCARNLQEATVTRSAPELQSCLQRLHLRGALPASFIVSTPYCRIEQLAGSAADLSAELRQLQWRYNVWEPVVHLAPVLVAPMLTLLALTHSVLLWRWNSLAKSPSCINLYVGISATLLFASAGGAALLLVCWREIGYHFVRSGWVGLLVLICSSSVCLFPGQWRRYRQLRIRRDLLKALPAF